MTTRNATTMRLAALAVAMAVGVWAQPAPSKVPAPVPASGGVSGASAVTGAGKVQVGTAAGVIGDSALTIGVVKLTSGVPSAAASTDLSDTAGLVRGASALTNAGASVMVGSTPGTLVEGVGAVTPPIKVTFDTTATTCTVVSGTATCTAAATGGVDNNPRLVITHNWHTTTDVPGFIGNNSSGVEFTTVTAIVATSTDVATISFSGATAGTGRIFTGDGMGPKGDTGAAGATGATGATGGGTASIGTYANLPGTPGAAGNLYFCTNCAFQFVSNGSTWQAYRRGDAVTIPPVYPGTWTDVNSISAAASAGAIFMTAPKASGNNHIRAITKAWTPANGAVITFDFMSIVPNSACGLTLSDGTKFQNLGVSNGANGSGAAAGAYLQVNNFSNADTYSASALNATPWMFLPAQIWFKVTQPTTTRTWYASKNGIDWMTIYSESPSDGAGTFATPTRVGFFCDANSNDGDVSGTLYGFVN